MKTKNIIKSIGKRALSAFLSANMLMFFYAFPIVQFGSLNTVQAAVSVTTPNGYVHSMTDNVGTASSSWYVTPNSSFYSTITSN